MLQLKTTTGYALGQGEWPVEIATEGKFKGKKCYLPQQEHEI